jgi:hypothetical protein
MRNSGADISIFPPGGLTSDRTMTAEFLFRNFNNRKRSTMSLRKSLALSCLFAALAAPALATAAPNMEEGNWEVTMKMEMQGMPFAMPPMKHNQCMTKKDMVPNTSPDKNSSCEVKEQEVSGDTVSWRVVCKDREGTTESEGKITYFGKRYEGAMKAKVTSKRGEATSINYQIQGRHTGACTAKTDPKQNKKAGDY